MNKQRNKTIGRTARVVGALAIAALLASCGGGGGSTPTPVVNLVNPATITPGFWAGTIANGPETSSRLSAIVMPDYTTWAAFETGVAVVGVGKAATTPTATNETTASLSSSGFYYSLTGSARQTLAATGSVTATALNATATINGTASTVALTPVAGYSTPAVIGSIANSTFIGNLGGGAVQVTWDFDGAGSLKLATSTSSTGCTYTGTVKPNASPIAVFDVAVTETCSGVARTLAGVATFKAAAGAVPASLRVIFTADAGVTGGLLALDKQ